MGVSEGDTGTDQILTQQIPAIHNRYEGRAREGRQQVGEVWVFREGSPELGWIRRMSLRVQQGVRNGVCYGRNLEKEMATHSSILAWKIPWTEEPGRLQSMGSQVKHMTEQRSTWVEVCPPQRDLVTLFAIEGSSQR